MPIDTWNPMPASCSALLVLALNSPAAISQNEAYQPDNESTSACDVAAQNSSIQTGPSKYQPGPRAVPYAEELPRETPEEQAVKQPGDTALYEPAAYNPPSYNAFATPRFFPPHPYQSPAGGYSGYASAEDPSPRYSFMRPPHGWFYPRAQSSTVPSGLVLPISLDTSISTQAAKPGDYIQAHISQNITLGGAGYLPGGTVVTGTVIASKAGRRGERSGSETIAFTQFRLPNGLLIPISAHLVGDIANYKNPGNDTFAGEGLGTKVLNLGLRTSASAGMGAVLGMGIGGISDGARGLGSGAWSGMAMGAGVGALESLVWRRGRDVLVHAGTQMQLQLDEPVEIPSPSRGAGPGYPQQGAR